MMTCAFHTQFTTKKMDSDDSDVMEGSSDEEGTLSEFQQAAERVQMLAAGLPKEKLLHLYARYKQVNNTCHIFHMSCRFIRVMIFQCFSATTDLDLKGAQLLQGHSIFGLIRGHIYMYEGK